ncbi:MAG: HlyD family efflux transporter periplasmic adaptor subunit [Magnetococcales bacterium]|nr:HlyD family efflux transporter periplasmic adaptor subunit [Magnetococcales bacterium]
MAGSRLPALREEVAVLPGPRAGDGAPTWTLHDPARHRFLRIDHATREILDRWHLGEPQAILDRLDRETSLRLTPRDLEEVLRFLLTEQLLRVTTPRETAVLLNRARLGRQGWATWLVHHYLFFRIPVLRPDTFLEALLPRVAFLYSRKTLIFFMVCLAIGMTQLLRQWDLFVQSLLQTLTWEGAFWYGVTLSGVKIVHELGHALTAKRYGCRVPTMGIGFLVLWPVFFTETTETWKLADARQRFAVAAAGVMAELMVAILALLAWNVLPDGLARGMAFLLCTTTLISTLLINGSPFLRFDGYYLLSDFLDLHNLHQRAGALARWWLRRRLFAFPDPPPEIFPPGRRTFLILFALATWLYRLVLFLGIAILVYHFFIKAVGIVLFLIEIIWFILLPVWLELEVWWMRRSEIIHGPRARAWAVALLLVALLMVIPWQTRIMAPAMRQAARQAALFAPHPGRLIGLEAAQGARVAEGALLFEVATPDIEHKRAKNTKRRQVLEWEWAVAGVTPLLLEQSQVLLSQLATNVTEGLSLQREAARNRILAPFAGRVVDLVPDLRIGQWLSNRERLGTILAEGPTVVHAYLTEEELARVTTGQSARFYPDNPDAAAMPCRVTAIDRGSVRHLADPLLANMYGGEIPVRDTPAQTLLPEQALYRIVLEGGAPFPADHRQRGMLRLEGQARGLADRLGRAILAVLLRESGF